MSWGEDRFASALEAAVLPPPTRGGEVRVATIHRYKGLEAPVVALCELDGRVREEELSALLYVGATRARSHLVVVCSEGVAKQLRSRGGADT